MERNIMAEDKSIAIRDQINRALSEAGLAGQHQKMKTDPNRPDWLESTPLW